MRNKGSTLRRATAILLISPLLLCVPFGASAQTDAKAEARKHFKRGVVLVEEGAYEQAAVEFKRAYQASPHYSVQYNLGMAYVMLGKPVEAVEALERYLEDGGDRIPFSRRAQVTGEIEEQNTRIAHLELLIRPEGATVKVDGAEVGQSPLARPVRLKGGIHTVSVTMDGYEPVEQKVELAGEERRTIEVELEAVAPVLPMAPTPDPDATAPEPAAETDPAPTPPEMVEPVSSRKQKEEPVETDEGEGGNTAAVVGWVLLGTGAAGFAAAGALGYLAYDLKEDLDSQCPDRKCPASLQGDIDRGNAFTLGANISMIAGGTLALTGLVVLLVASLSGDEEEEKANLRASPLASPGTFGLQVEGSL